MSFRKGAMLILACGLVYVVWWISNKKEPPEVELYTVTRGQVEQTVSNTRAGTIKACRHSLLSMAIGGRVDTLNVDEGDHVKAGEVLLSLWNADRRATTAQAEAQLLAAEHRREQVCVEAKNAVREAARLATLRERKLASEEAAEQAQTQAEASRFACQAARDEEKMASANVAANKALLEETYLRAPFAGVIAEINGELGEYVTPSPPGVATPPAVDLIDYSCLYVTAPIDEVDAGHLRTDLPTRIRLDALRDETFNGRLTRIAPYVLDLERQARTVEVDVQFTDQSTIERLLVGYSADIDVILDTREEVLRIPTEAILEDEKVYRYDEATARVHQVPIKRGLFNWDFSEIIDGLKEGDRILLSLDTPDLEEGLRVRIAND